MTSFPKGILKNLQKLAKLRGQGLQEGSRERVRSIGVSLGGAMWNFCKQKKQLIK